MCGRMTHANLTWQQLMMWQAYGIKPAEAEIATSYNVPPTTMIPIIRLQEGEHVGDFARWGLIPHWYRKETREWRAATFNARIEDVASKPAFREAYRHGRCLVPISGYYEWRKRDGGKQPYYFHPAGNAPALLLAGLWSSVRLPDYEGLTCTVLTGPAAPEAAAIHHRMPVLLSQAGGEDWLDGAGAEAVERLPTGQLAWHPVGRSVGSVRNDEPALIEEIEAE